MPLTSLYDECHTGQEGGILRLLPGEKAELLFNDRLRYTSNKLLGKLAAGELVDPEFLAETIGTLTRMSLEGKSYQAGHFLCRFFDQTPTGQDGVPMANRVVSYFGPPEALGSVDFQTSDPAVIEQFDNSEVLQSALQVAESVNQ